MIGARVGIYSSVSGIAAPTVSAISSDEFSQGENYTNVVITGTSFTTATSVSLGAGITINSYTIDSDTQITLTDFDVALTATLGARDVSVTNPVGTGVLTDGIDVVFGFVNALQFDGVNDYVSHSNVVLSGDFTVSMWFNSSNLVRMLWSSSNIQYIYIEGSTSIRFFMGAAYSFTVPTLSTNTWYHVAFTRSGTTVKCYLNGVASVTTHTSANTLTLNKLGYNSSFPLLSFSGQLDEVGTIQTELSAANISSLYNSGNGNLLTDYGSPDIYYRLNESGTDTTAVDSSGNGNDGTLINFPTSGMWIPNRTGQTPTVMYPSWDVLESNISVSDNGSPTNRVTRTAGGVYEGAVDSVMGLDDFTLDYIVQASGELYKYIAVTTDNTQAKATPQAHAAFFIVNTSDVRIRVDNADLAYTTIVAGDILTITRVSGVTKFFKNGTLLYTKVGNNGGQAVYPMALPGDPAIYVMGIKITGYLYMV